MTEANNIVKDFKAPPTLGKDSLYVNWEKEIKIWKAFTSVPEEICVPTIFITLTAEVREAILNVDIEQLTEKTGVNDLIAELEKMSSINESSQAYEAYETFENL